MTHYRDMTPDQKRLYNHLVDIYTTEQEKHGLKGGRDLFIFCSSAIISNFKRSSIEALLFQNETTNKQQTKLNTIESNLNRVKTSMKELKE